MDSSSKKNVVVAYIPDDLIINILQSLPAKSLMRFKCVCKKWRTLFSHKNRLILIPWRPDGYELGMRSVEIDFEGSKHEAMQVDFPFPVECWFPRRNPIGCCDGLLCIPIIEKEKQAAAAIVWNPSLRRYKKVRIPIHTRILTYRDYFYADRFGFGYDHSTQDYKIVRIYHKLREQGYHVEEYKTFFQTYSLNTNSWEQQVTLPWLIDFYPTRLTGFGISVNEALYWPIKFVQNERKFPCILCFDLPDQKFRLIHSPMDSAGYLLDFGGRLCMVSEHYRPPIYNPTDIWIMEEEKQTQNWIKLMTIPPLPAAEILQIREAWIGLQRVLCLKNGEVLLMITVWTESPTDNVETKLILYNNEENTFKKFEIDGAPPVSYYVASYSEILFTSSSSVSSVTTARADALLLTN